MRICNKRGSMQSHSNATTAQRMLDLFENIGEIKKYSEGIYRLHEDGLIYQHLAEKLASTP